MYKAHSKDINRNKSFHPLTFSNLRKVEKLKEKAAAEEQIHNERINELNRDQEKRRYDELLLNSSLSPGPASGDRVQGVGLAHSLQVRKVFAAEYKRESEGSQRQNEAKTPVVQTLKGSSQDNFLIKFRQDVALGETVALKTPPISAERDQEGDKKVAYPKCCRDEGDLSKNEPSACTGLVTSSEVYKIKKERDLLQKQRLDPQLRVAAYQNQTLNEAARLRDRQSELMQSEKKRLKDSERSRNGNYIKSKEQDAIEERIRSILKMRKTE
ncbi:unnamed protein product [Phytomonas sp. EM1]|nr:unnamed protein product [Phytomonas sp. EM1]|eukprot:CCW64697.1 unnamed protein product [Phytomonas sp. isolate EM1]